MSVCWHELATPLQVVPALAGHWATLNEPSRAHPLGPPRAGMAAASAEATQQHSGRHEKGGCHPALSISLTDPQVVSQLCGAAQGGDVSWVTP